MPQLNSEDTKTRRLEDKAMPAISPKSEAFTWQVIPNPPSTRRCLALASRLRAFVVHIQLRRSSQRLKVRVKAQRRDRDNAGAGRGIDRGTGARDHIHVVRHGASRAPVPRLKQALPTSSRRHSHPASRNPSASPTVAIWSALSQKRQKQRYIWCSRKNG